ncbi:MAG: hypothetical protein ABI607_04950 [Betaproteobacteria bacterium]
MLKDLVVTGVLGASVMFAAVACAQQYGPPPSSGEPRLNVDPGRRGNIARAQEFSRQAYDAMAAAQQANEFDMAGHAARAKELLRQANDEMKLAALAANRR